MAPGTAGVEARDQLLSALNEYKDKTVALHASGSGISEEKFLSCVSKVLCEKKGKKNEVRKGGSIPRCSKILKILWLCILCLLTFGLLAAGFKPLSFRLHQVKKVDLAYWKFYINFLPPLNFCMNLLILVLVAVQNVSLIQHLSPGYCIYILYQLSLHGSKLLGGANN